VGSLLLGALLLGACAAAPVLWDEVPSDKPLYPYAGVHGIPLAYGGGVCAVGDPHRHSFPPVPRAAYEIDGEGYAADTRATWPFHDPHPHHGRTCFRERWHLHLEPPSARLFWSDEVEAYVADGERLLVPFAGAHAALTCEPRACAFDAPHAHVGCDGPPAVSSTSAASGR
jgi:hypothetical protein